MEKPCLNDKKSDFPFFLHFRTKEGFFDDKSKTVYEIPKYLSRYNVFKYPVYDTKQAKRH